jgi:archaellum component FlaF (FlaF/FlaG flagellin family)
MRKGPESVYDKLNISVVICDIDVPEHNSQVMVATVNFQSDDFNLTYMNPWFSSVLVSEQTSIEENTTRIKE